MKVEFIKNPTGPFGLSHGPGDVVDFSDEFAKQLIETGYAVQAKEAAISDDDTEDSESEDPEGAETTSLKAAKGKAKK